MLPSPALLNRAWSKRMSMNKLAGKNVVVIGGTSGIGLATALAASDLGARVWAAGRSDEHVESAKRIAGDRVTVMRADTHDQDRKSVV